MARSMMHYFHYSILRFSLLLIAGKCQETKSNSFSQEHSICDVSERIDRECSKFVPKSRSRVDCMTRCNLDRHCIGASVDQAGGCFHHKECPMLSDCTVSDDGHNYFTKYCKHGYRNNGSQFCECVDGFYGSRCTQCHAGCNDLTAAGYSVGYHKVYLDPDHDGKKPFIVYCKTIAPNYSKVIVLNNMGEYNFNRTWAEYVNGFYFDRDNKWIGLYAMHRLSNSPFYKTLRFSFAVDDWKVSRLYLGVIISDESTKYSLTYSGTGSGSHSSPPSEMYFPDCLASLKDLPFSTWDADHDQSLDQNCAANAGSAWWYRDCNNFCNVLGFGYPYRHSKPQEQLFSLIGVDMGAPIAEDGFFFANFEP